MNPFLKSIMAAIAAGVALTTLPAHAEYPDRPIRTIVPFAPGGNADVTARLVTQALSEKLGQTFVIENRAGAGGTIGAAQVARAKPDGYTLVAVSSGFTTNAAIQPSLPFDPVKDFKGVAMMAKGPFIVAVRESLPISSVSELIAMAKERPGELNYSSSGPGSSNQFATEMFNTAAGVNMTHVPYRGMGPATAALMGDQVDVLIASGPSLLPAINTGKAKAIAITSAEASPIAPQLPPVAKDVPGYEFTIWWGILAPADTPDAVVEKLNEAIQTVVAMPEIHDFFVREGAEPASGGAAAFQRQIVDDIALWKKVAADSNITAQK